MSQPLQFPGAWARRTITITIEDPLGDEAPFGRLREEVAQRGLEARELDAVAERILRLYRERQKVGGSQGPSDI